MWHTILDRAAGSGSGRGAGSGAGPGKGSGSGTGPAPAPARAPVRSGAGSGAGRAGRARARRGHGHRPGSGCGAGSGTGAGSVLWVLSTAAFCANAAGLPRRALELADQGRALIAGEPESTWKAPQFGWARGQALLASGDLAGAAAEAQAGYDAAVADGAAMRAGGYALVRGLLGQQGRFDTAAGRLRDAVALLGNMDPYRLVSLALAELGLTLARAGLTDDASAALDEADSRRGGAVGALGGVIGLGRLWCDAWAGRRTVAAGGALELAAAAVAVGNRVDAVAAAHTAAVLGASGQAAVVLDGLAGTMEGPWVVLHAAEATARSRHDPASLLDTAERYAALGANGLGAVTAAAARALSVRGPQRRRPLGRRSVPRTPCFHRRTAVRARPRRPDAPRVAGGRAGC